MRGKYFVIQVEMFLWAILKMRKKLKRQLTRMDSFILETKDVWTNIITCILQGELNNLLLRQAAKIFLQF
jgi:hypothetical protein